MRIYLRPLSSLLPAIELTTCLILAGLTATAQTASVEDLPVTRVSLYKNGVGFFEHSGRVTGSQPVSIDFTTAQLNDVLQSLTAIDLDGGHIAGAGYNSTMPLEQQLKALPLGLGEDASAADLYNAVRGARVEVHSGTTVVMGRLLKVEVVNGGAQAPEKRTITVVGDTGEIHTLDLNSATVVRLLDATLDTDLTRYLELLASTRNQGMRHLTLNDDGTGTRQLMVSYISEVPVWKSTYRILFNEPKPGEAATATATLQGWSVVDNTTGADWNNVRLSLIAGAPQSFIQPLSVPYYSRRPEIALPQEAQLTPQTHESGEFAQSATMSVRAGSGIQGQIVDPSGAEVGRAQVTATNTDTGVRYSRVTNASGTFAITPMPAGPYNVEVVAPGFQRLFQENVIVSNGSAIGLRLRLEVGAATETVTVTAAPPMLDTSDATLGGTIENRQYSSLPLSMSGGPRDAAAFQYLMPGAVEDAARKSMVAAAATSAFDDYFAYNLTEPITIRKNESALVPILQTKIASEPVTLWSPGHPVPLRALWITNTSDLTLDRGSFSIVEDGNFGGEGLMEPIHPKEKRLLSYAVDQAVRMTTEGADNVNKITEIAASKGVLVLSSSSKSQVTYVVHNAAPQARTVVIEHPLRAGYVLDAGLTPAEITPDAYRFRVTAPAGETVRLQVAETFPGEVRFELTDSDDDQFAAILRESQQNPQLIAAFKPILDARKKSSDADDAVSDIQKRLESLHADEERQRANVTAVAAADKASRDRFVHDLNVSEDKIAAAQKELAAAQVTQKTADDDLSAKIAAIQLDEKL